MIFLQEIAAKFLHSIGIMVGNFSTFWVFNYKDNWKFWSFCVNLMVFIITNTQ
jgi:hypothetical protein